MKYQYTSRTNKQLRTQHMRVWTIISVLAAVVCAVVLTGTSKISDVVPVAQAADHSMKCYSDGFDRDGDGYAGLNTEDAKSAYKTFSWDGKGRTNCPSHYVRFINDCNDRDPNVNAGKPERGLNGKDDNCNGRVDESTFEYFEEGNHNSTYGFEMLVHLNSQDILDQKAAGRLYADVEYARLKDSDNVLKREKFLVNMFNRDSSAARISVAVSNSDSATVFRARVHFFRRSEDGQFHKVGLWSNWYYTMTNGEMDKTRTRARIVLKGLKEYSDSLNGLVGYRGTADVDGTRYHADRNEIWCSEFYVWVTKHWLPGVEGIDTCDDLVDFFKDNHSLYSATELSTRAAPGDYLPIDSNKDGKTNHSAMFLAYDTTKNVVWTLEGNSGDKVDVNTRKLEEIRGLGYLRNSELR